MTRPRARAARLLSGAVAFFLCLAPVAVEAKAYYDALLSVPVGDDGIHYSEPAPEQLPSGPSSLRLGDEVQPGAELVIEGSRFGPHPRRPCSDRE